MHNESSSYTREEQLLTYVYQYLLQQARLRHRMQLQSQIEKTDDSDQSSIVPSESPPQQDTIHTELANVNSRH